MRPDIFAVSPESFTSHKTPHSSDMHHPERTTANGFSWLYNLFRFFLYLLDIKSPNDGFGFLDAGLRVKLDLEWNLLKDDAQTYEKDLEDELKRVVNLLDSFRQKIYDFIDNIPSWRADYLSWQEDTWKTLEGPSRPDSFSQIEHYWLRMFFTFLHQETNTLSVEDKVTRLITILNEVGSGKIDLSSVVDPRHHQPKAFQRNSFFSGIEAPSGGPEGVYGDGISYQSTTVYSLDLVGLDLNTEAQTVWLRNEIEKTLLTDLAHALLSHVEPSLITKATQRLKPVLIPTQLPIEDYWKAAKPYITKLPKKYNNKLQAIFLAIATKRLITPHRASQPFDDWDIVTNLFSEPISSFVNKWHHAMSSTQGFGDDFELVVSMRRLSDILLQIKAAAAIDIKSGQTIIVSHPSNIWMLKEMLKDVMALINRLDEYSDFLPEQQFRDLNQLAVQLEGLIPLLEIKKDILDD